MTQSSEVTTEQAAQIVLTIIAVVQLFGLIGGAGFLAWQIHRSFLKMNRNLAKFWMEAGAVGVAVALAIIGLLVIPYPAPELRGTTEIWIRRSIFMVAFQTAVFAMWAKAYGWFAFHRGLSRARMLQEIAQASAPRTLGTLHFWHYELSLRRYPAV